MCIRDRNKHEANEGIVHAGGDGRSNRKKKKKKRQLGAAVGGGVADAAGGSVSALEFGPVESRTNYDVKAESFGYIKVYNPVDEARLTGKKVETDEDADADTSQPKP